MRVHSICICMAAVLSLMWTSTAWATGCTADIANDDAQVSVPDLLELLGNWGTDGPGSDLAEPNDVVGVSDLLEMLSQWGECPFPSCGGSEAGNCFLANGTPGCQDEDCCKTVCDADNFCCDVEWDSLCVDTALDLCGNAACPGEGDCFSANGTPGCEDETCCNIVCSIDPFCCDSEWDGICADEANDNCPNAPAQGACCLPDGTCTDGLTAEQCSDKGGEFQDEGTTCNDVQCGNAACPGEGDCFADNGTPGCNDEACCNTVCAIDAFCCDSEWDLLCAEQAFANCTECGDEDAGSCFEANGTPGCDDADCCATVCVEDAFCCETEWDSLCADTAAELCAGCGSEDAGDCFFANGTPGCEDLECCQAVCSIDPFCCESQWDSLCADTANTECGNAACPGEGDCFTANDTPGCEDEACCNEVCAIDAFCCDSEWDSLCAEAAFANCTECGDDDAGSCFEANGTPGCDDATCCASVCFDDPFCCENEWDSLCADAAAKDGACT